MDRLKIYKLTAENFKRLKAVSIEPQTDVVAVTGRNEQGKSSTLDAIWGRSRWE
jgi:recombinational DNA repair ATPase RecF